MLRRILIANRGEIAVRILRTCRRLGLETVAVFSEADRDSLHVRLADAAICIGPAESARSYLHLPSIISAAEIADVDAIHPGYGFLAENAHFADVCRSLDIAFIGPTSEAITAMGEKAGARAMAAQAGVPVLPGSDGLVETDEDAFHIARRIGYPVIIKATAGGGGRGIRVAHNDVALRLSIAQARAEAGAAFGDTGIYIEKFLEHPRHVEIQILCDHHGNMIHLGERDCTIQRRHQKLLEEAPSPAIDRSTRRAMGEAALALCKACGYRNAGTVEFLYEKGQFYFMEMNTRIQVEHPVTEMITGTDLIEEQIRVAAGEKLRLRQRDVRIEGHAIECRINAEDPDNNFAPSPGLVDMFVSPTATNIRVDSFIYSGYRIPPYYDSMIGKLIVRGTDRADAVQRARNALAEFIIEGVRTTVPFHRSLLENAQFVNGEYDINFVAQTML
jgi:acetyl-CoA carboxylase biotin carboxylase subunit